MNCEALEQKGALDCPYADKKATEAGMTAVEWSKVCGFVDCWAHKDYPPKKRIEAYYSQQKGKINMARERITK